MRQSGRFACYGEALSTLEAQGFLYPCFCSRKEIARDSADLGRDPDGAPLYSGRCRSLPAEEVASRRGAGEPFALRLRMAEAERLAGPLSWNEGLPDAPVETIAARPSRWGDAVLRRKEFPASYHLAVVVDDAAQGVTHVVRGQDLFESTAVHRLLQTLLGLPEPRYYHHPLIRDAEGAKLSKSLGSRSLADLRAEGLTPEAVRAMASLHP